jgi:hypothetical protein
MSQISIVLDDNSRYTIELVDKYSPEEFISAFENHISKVRKLMPSLGEPEAAPMPSLSVDKAVNTKLFKSPLFVKLNTMIESYCKNIRMKDGTSMRSFIYTKPIKGAKTVTWLKPSGHKLIVLLQCRRNEDYSKIDSENKVKYDKRERGGFPYIDIKSEDEIEYAFNLIKYAYDSRESRQ